MLSAEKIKRAAVRLGADKCGIAGVERFAGAPKGFLPTDIYPACRSVAVFLKSLPEAALLANNPVPYTHIAEHLLFAEVDQIGLELSRVLERAGIYAVPIPCDMPYLHWDAARTHGIAVLSMRHAGMLAGLGVLGRNTLLINREMGNLMGIGAVLLDAAVESDPLVSGFKCPPKCRLCLDSCPVGALDGVTVNQALCRKNSSMKTARGFEIITCNQCRIVCPRRRGTKRPRKDGLGRPKD
jgi:epoxyqueuosine reductase